MSIIDQCPSTKPGAKGVSAEKAQEIPAEAAELGRLSGRAYWRSVEEYSGTPEFKEFVEREFPSGASELLAGGRRDFMKLMGAGLALAGAATIPGCRRPDLKILTYSREVPEHSIPGKPLYYASSFSLPGGGAYGILAETHSGRPTKLEGNPMHPVNRGASTAQTHSHLLSMYDPDRLKQPTVYIEETGERRLATWDDFKQNARGLPSLARFDETGGRGLAIIADGVSSPTRDAMKLRILRRWRNVRWVDHSPTATGNAAEGTRAALGDAQRRQLRLDRADVVVSFDDDVIGSGPAALVAERAFCAKRGPETYTDTMARLYVLETGVTTTGMTADHRFRVAPSRLPGWAAVVCREVLSLQGEGFGALSEALAALGDPSAGDEFSVEYARLIAEDLVEHSGRSVVVAGDSMPPEVHALVAAVNQALNNDGVTVSYLPDRSAEPGLSAATASSLSDVVAGLNAGDIETVICINTNPAYDAPETFAPALENAQQVIVYNLHASETGATAQWELNATHDLEAWGDTQSWDGTIAPRQPMIAPLYEPALSEIEFMAMLAGVETPEGQSLVRENWAGRFGLMADSPEFDRRWRRALHDGVLAGATPTPNAPRVRVADIAALVGSMQFADAPTAQSLDVKFVESFVGDGRHANNAWLQEVPQAGTMVVWDNPACVSPATAEALGLEPRGGAENPYTRGQLPRALVANMSVDGREMEIPVWVLPGMPDNTVLLTVGYGRERVGRVGEGVGFNTYKLHTGRATARGATLSRVVGRSYEIVSTQNHWSLEGRTALVRAVDKKWFDKHVKKFEEQNGGVKITPDKIYGSVIGESELNLAEQLGELTHTPDNRSIYENPQNQSRENPAEGSVFSKGPQWGMTIDMSKCTGCNACVTACQAENNIPTVGKREVAKGREMHWVRVDRYYVGDNLNDPDEVLNQPVSCVHCENAPCEVVCPVNATVHGPEGTNNMSYNRCIGTRYCSNNCPYKVRRFNFFDYGQTKFNGGFIGDDVVPEPRNPNFIPPRLREQLDEISKMKMNPDVTVRGRGVMEKCTYCIQRINAARQEAKIRNVWTDEVPIPDGFFQVACEQACASGATVFGDILDPSSRVAQSRVSQRSFLLLGYLNTRPRTSYLMRIRNPYQPLLERVWADRLERGVIDQEAYDERINKDPFEKHGHGGGHGDGHGDDHDHDHGEEHGRLEPVFRDRTRSQEDSGYAMSLRVLGQRVGSMGMGV